MYPFTHHVIASYLFSYIYDLRGAHFFHRIGPYKTCRRWPAIYPRQPFPRADPHNVGKTLHSPPRAFQDGDVPKPPRFMHGVLRSGSANTRSRRDSVDRKIAVAVQLYLPGNDAQHRPFTLGVFPAQLRRHAARTAEHAAAIPRCLPIGRALRFARGKPPLNAASQPANIRHSAVRRRRPAAGWAPALNTFGEILGLAISYRTGRPFLAP